MGYVYLLLVALMFSLGGTCVKLIRPDFAVSFRRHWKWLAWGVLFFHEPVTVWTVLGTVLFVLGIIFIQCRGRTAGA